MKSFKQKLASFPSSGNYELQLQYIPESFSIHGDGTVTASVDIYYQGPIRLPQMPASVLRGSMAIAPGANNADVIERANDFTIGEYTVSVTTDGPVDLWALFPFNQSSY